MSTPAVLSAHAPRRCWSPSGTPGKWYSHPYTIDDVNETLSGGGWFAPGRHEFADQRAAVAAGQSVFRPKVAKIPKTLFDVDAEIEALFAEPVSIVRLED